MFSKNFLFNLMRFFIIAVIVAGLFGPWILSLVLALLAGPILWRGLFAKTGDDGRPSLYVHSDLHHLVR